MLIVINFYHKNLLDGFVTVKQYGGICIQRDKMVSKVSRKRRKQQLNQIVNSGK